MKYKKRSWVLYFGILLSSLEWGKRQYGLVFFFGVQFHWHHENLFVDENNFSEVSSRSRKTRQASPKLDILDLSTILLVFSCSTSVQMCLQLWNLASFITLSQIHLTLLKKSIASIPPLYSQNSSYTLVIALLALYCDSLLKCLTSQWQ